MSFASRLCWYFLALSLSLNCLQPASSASAVQNSADETALRALAESFFNTWAAKDLDGFLRQWSAKAPELPARKKAMQELFASGEKVVLKSFAVRQVKPEGDKARVRVEANLQSVEMQAGKEKPGYGKLLRTLECVKEAGAWKVWRELSAVEDLAALLSAADEQTRAALRESEKEMFTIELRQEFQRHGYRLLERRDLKQAAVAFQLARELAEVLADREGVAHALYGLGDTAVARADNAVATEYFQQSLQLHTALGNKAQAAKLTENIGSGHYQLGNYETALEYCRKARTLYGELQAKDDVAAVWITTGVIRRAQGDYSQALDAYRQARAILETTGNKAELTRLANSTGLVLRAQGNYRLALAQHQQSLKLARETGNKLGIAGALANIGTIHRLQNNYDLALDFFQQAATLQEQAGERHSFAGMQLNLGLTYKNMGDYDRALEFYRKSLALAEAISNKRLIALLRLNLGVLHTERGEFPVALEHLQKALTFYETVGDRSTTARVLGSISKLYYDQGDYKQALSLAEQALAVAEQTGSPEVLMPVHDMLGRVQFALGNDSDARQAYEKEIAEIEMLRAEAAGGEQDRQRLLETRLSPWKGMVRLLVKQKQPQEALMFAEQARARVLLDVLQSGRINISKSMRAEEQEQEQKLRAEITAVNASLSRASQAGKPDQPRINDLEARRDKARRAYEAFQTSLYAAHPELRVQRGEAPTISPAELTALLPDAASALLEYVVTDEMTYLFAVTKGAGKPAAEVQVFTLPIKQAELAQRIESFRQQLAGRNLGFRDTARQLYDLLLKPSQALLRDKTRLIIVPDDNLWDLPFQALLTGANHFVIEDAALSYAPSLSVLREMTTRQRPATAASSATLLALGNPLLGQATLERATLALRDEKLSPLPEAEAEVKALGRLFGAMRSKVYVGAEAREDRAKAEAGQARVLHFATHGVLNNAAPLYSHLVLAPGDSREDGLLEAWELMQMDLKAELAVLSACETARGRFGAGEGMIGLTWALFVAGVPATLVSQWKVESAGTRDLMLNFHRGLRAPIAAGRPTKAEAIRQAALKLMKNPETSHPFYWAGFVLIGDGR
jgi:CHAT domain-containing protein/tetratricopeptide (TPR) repeat protein